MSFAGAERSSVRGIRRQFQVVTIPVTDAVRASIEDVTSHGAQLPCSGDLFGNIQTQASIEVLSCEGVMGLSDWVMTLGISEIQSSSVILRYEPGQTITGESFTRSTAAYQINASGVLESKAINVKRDGHYIGGVKSFLLEGASTNNLLWSTDFSNAAWVKTTTTVGTGIADPAGGTQACTLTATGANAQVLQTLSAGVSGQRNNSVWLRRRTGTGQINIWQPVSLVWSPITLTATWQRFNITDSAGTARQNAIQIVANGDAIDAFGAQNEDRTYATSTIITTTTALARGSDFYSLPFTAPPQEMSVYAKFVEAGTQIASGRVFTIASAADANARLLLAGTGTIYQSVHITAGGIVVGALAAVPALGDTVELEARLFGDGSVDTTQSLNGAAATASAQSAALALATAWSGQLCWLNSDGTNATAVGFGALQSFKIVAGARSLSEMRNA